MNVKEASPQKYADSVCESPAFPVADYIMPESSETTIDEYIDGRGAY